MAISQNFYFDIYSPLFLCAIEVAGCDFRSEFEKVRMQNETIVYYPDGSIVLGNDEDIHQETNFFSKYIDEIFSVKAGDSKAAFRYPNWKNLCCFYTQRSNNINNNTLCLYASFVIDWPDGALFIREPFFWGWPTKVEIPALSIDNIPITVVFHRRLNKVHPESEYLRVGRY